MLYEGDTLRVKMLVKEFARQEQGTRIYTVAAVKIEEAHVNRGDRESLPVSVPPAGFQERMARLISAVKGEGVSKVGRYKKSLRLPLSTAIHTR
jgi:hypothetical protein